VADENYKRKLTAILTADVQERLGHRYVKTTMIYTHVLNRCEKGVKSPVYDL
jgi:integrase